MLKWSAIQLFRRSLTLVGVCWLFSVCLTVFAANLLFSTTVRAADFDLCTPTVESFSVLPCDAESGEVAAAASEGAAWPHDLFEVVVFVAKRFGLSQCDDTCLTIDKEPFEGCSIAVATVVQQGYADDSIAGLWTEIRLSRSSDGIWGVSEVRQAALCRRGDFGNAYQKSPCP